METNGRCEFFTLAPACFWSRQLELAKHIHEPEEERRRRGLRVGESAWFTHRLLGGLAPFLSLWLLRRKAMIPVEKSHFCSLGFALFSGTYWRDWSFLSKIILSVGSYRLCENSLRMISFPMEGEVTGWSYLGNTGPRIQASCLNSGSRTYGSPTSARTSFSGPGEGRWSEAGVGRRRDPVWTGRGEGIPWESLFCFVFLLW